MEISVFLLQSLLFVLLFLQASPSISAKTTNTNVTDFSCSPVSSSCQTFVVYRTEAPGFLNVGNISDLFGTSRLSIMRANNLSTPDDTYDPGQLMLVPITCGCTGNMSYANVTYQIMLGDSFWLVSVIQFENLTNAIAVQDLNPALVPTNLKAGQQVIFPLFCKCPSKTQLDSGVKFLISYVWQEEDKLSQLSKTLNSSVQAIVAANNYRNFSDAVRQPVLIPVTQPPRLPQLMSNNTVLVQDEKSKSHRTIIIVSATVGSIVALILISFLAFFTFSMRQRKKVLNRVGSSLETNNLLCFKRPSNVDNLRPKTLVEKLLPGVSQYLDKPVVFTFKDILDATKNFDENFRIGSSVYRAMIDGQLLAVKKTKGDVTEELRVLHTVSHANLVKLGGVSITADGDFLLLFEYAENGSLDKWLYPKDSTSSSGKFGSLSWKQRLNIALDVANGLQYMHEHIRPSIVHGDIRARNILLGGHYKAKISSFAKARAAMLPITPAADVLAFGIILLELLSGRRVVAATEGSGEMTVLWKEMRVILEREDQKEVKLREWMDPRLGSHYPIDGALNLAALAKSCTSETTLERPSIGEIVFGLSVVSQSSTQSSIDTSEQQVKAESDESIELKKQLAAR